MLNFPEEIIVSVMNAEEMNITITPNEDTNVKGDLNGNWINFGITLMVFVAVILCGYLVYQIYLLCTTDPPEENNSGESEDTNSTDVETTEL